MNRPAWQLEGSQARLEIAGLRATLDAARPLCGLAQVCIDDLPLDDLRLLAMDLPSCGASERAPLADCHLRGDDLAASYQESPATPVQVDALWTAAVSEGVVAAVELLLSIRTSQPEIRPHLAVSSAAPADEVLRLTDPATASYRELTRPGVGEEVMRPQSGPSCLVFRMPGNAWSFAEMTHPADFREDRLTRCQSGHWQLCHRLFPETLEKGVLVRARMRVVWLRRQGDLQSAAACCAAFAASEPRLGT